MAVTCFEDLVAWQKARELARAVYSVSQLGAFAKDYGFANQIQRAAVSTMSNIAEGFERGTPKEFHRYLTTSKGSIGEVRSLLYLAHDIGYLSGVQFEQLYPQATEVARVIGGLRTAAQRRVAASTAKSRRPAQP